MKKEDVIKKLRNDEDYYGNFGKKYLSNSDISALLTRLYLRQLETLKLIKRCLVVNYVYYSTKSMQ